MKRFFTGAAFFFFFSTAFLSADIGFGPLASFSVSTPSARDFSASVDDFYSLSVAADFSPWNLSAGIFPHKKTFVFTADNWWIYRRISGPLNYAFFWGNWTSVCLDDEKEFLSGPRLGLALNLFLFPGNHVELFSHVAWNPLFGLKKDDDWALSFRPYVFPASAGLRFWLR